jgi:hypothetical protein
MRERHHRARRWGPGDCGALALPPVSTRRLILAALLCGMAILVAFTIQILVA